MTSNQQGALTAGSAASAEADHKRFTIMCETPTEMRVRVGVALRRPPVVDEWRKVIVAAHDETEAQLIACQISACTSVMPVVSWIDRGKERA